MSDAHVEAIANAVLYEGYMLYPYRASIKNQRRWTFGSLLPCAYSEADGGHERWDMRTQCLVSGSAESVVNVRGRFLHLVNRTVGVLVEPQVDWPVGDEEPAFEPRSTLHVEGQRYQSWQEAVEREAQVSAMNLGALIRRPVCETFHFPGRRDMEPLRESTGQVAGVLMHEQRPISGRLTLAAEQLGTELYRITATIVNDASLSETDQITRDEAMMSGFASTHIILSVRGGCFVSLMDPPACWRSAVEGCENRGCWPVLVGEPGQTDTILASPIILYDHPQIAPQSPGDLFDGTEIDELLSLRVMTLTDEEKREAASTDDRTRALLERTESLARDQMSRLHGEMHRAGDPPANGDKPASVKVGEYELKAGDRVRLQPKGHADAFDVLLRGMTATVQSIEQDYENRVYLAVSVDDDPGMEYATAGQPGHRFFFAPEDVEPLPSQTSDKEREW